MDQNKIFKTDQSNKSSKKNKMSLWQKISFWALGVGGLVWFLIRVIPKPSRANYPCMKVAFPLASSFILYISGFFISAFFLKKAHVKIKEQKYRIVILMLFISTFSISFSLINKQGNVIASNVEIPKFNDPLGPNKPIGVGKGIIPGRVVWVHNPDATNENCTNINQSDAYWLEKNSNQSTVDEMLLEAILKITGKESAEEAWNGIFRYFNNSHNKGDVGYLQDETIFIKINAVTAYNGATSNGGKQPASTQIEYDTTPQAILAMLKHLVNVAKVPQKNIYVGDPIADLWDHVYQYLHTEFPDVNYVTRRSTANRYKLTASSVTGIYYSDKGTVMTDVKSHKFFKEMMEADYLINIPVMKGHRWGGVTFFAKNHFGSNTTDGSWQLHKGLMNPDDNGMRYGYGLYRVFVDLMGNKHLGGNTLIYFMDALWSTSYEHQRPQKFKSAPFNNDWSSSILISLDPVAIESVGIDILQKEFTEDSEEIIDNTNGTKVDRFTFVQWDGIDDYLHQAASSDYWPEGITYDPENDGTPIGSLGVHEHWNNATEMQYSKNLGNDNGIELVLIKQKKETAIKRFSNRNNDLFEIYPNPANKNISLKISTENKHSKNYKIIDLKGKVVSSQDIANIDATTIDIRDLKSGIYFLQVNSGSTTSTKSFIKE
jgi:hypothetical protein